MSPELQAGICFEWQYTVPQRATVPALFHDTPLACDMPAVMATGYMVGLMELACTQGIMPYVDWPHEQSLGTHVSFSHLAATPPGMTLTIKGEVTAVIGKRIRFKVEALDGLDKMSEGEHERCLITPEKFHLRLADKIARAGLCVDDQMPAS